MATSAQICRQLVEALQLDLLGPGWDDGARRQERLPQPPSIWYITGFLVPNTVQEEAGRPPDGNAPSYADQAGEDPSIDAANRQEDREGDDDANGSQEECSSKRNSYSRFQAEPNRLTNICLLMITPTVPPEPAAPERSPACHPSPPSAAP
jgi:hypothetical protein